MSDNPYAPPKAVVADPVADGAPVSAQPYAATLATHLLWSGLALGTLNLAIVGSLATSVDSVVVLGLLALLTHKISHGRNWARITFLVLFLLGLPGIPSATSILWQQSPLVAVISLVVSGLQMGALYLVFIGDGARWFRHGKGLR